MDIDSLVGVGTIGRLLGDLKDSPFETDGIVVAYGTLLLKTQGLGDLVQADFSPGGHRVSRGVRELTVMLGEVAEKSLTPDNFDDCSLLDRTPVPITIEFELREGARMSVYGRTI